MTQNLQDLKQKIDEAKTQLDQLRPIKLEYNSAICQKFQLEFNYHSNHIEGNTLTLGETKNLILRGMEVSIAKKFRDILEMKGHLDAYDTLGFLTDRVITEDRLPLRLDQSFIKNLHKIIFVEDKQIHSEDDGIQSVTVIPAGEYKKHQNHVITNTGAKFEYSEPWQVPQMMQDLLDWYNNSRESIHPIILASIFHYKFIRIHPFGDGNGRTARLLMNLILQSSGHVIAMVKSDAESKSSYLNSLSLVDNNFVDIQDCIIESNEDLFETFIIEIGNCLLDSYDIMIRGAKGEDITDAGDIIKLAEIREMKNTNVQYSLDEIKADPKLWNKLVREIESLKELQKEYFVKVLKKKFFKAEVLDINQEDFFSESDYFESSFGFKRINYNLSEYRDENKRIEDFLKFDLVYIYSNGKYVVASKAIGFEISIYYLDKDFENKAKQMIQKIDNYVIEQSNNF